MNDFEDRLRETLRRRAGAVSRREQVPPGLVHRAGLRIARNAAAALVALAVVSGGLITGVHALSSSRQTPAATPTAAPECRAGQLSGVSRLMIPATDPQAREGALILTNQGSTSCSLQGQPAIAIRDATGFVTPTREKKIDPFWMAHGPTPPPDWPLVILQPGDSAVVHVKWTNWCGNPTNRPTTWEIALPARGTVRFTLDQAQEIPQCSKAASRSKLEVGPFEPFTRQT